MHCIIHFAAVLLPFIGRGLCSRLGRLAGGSWARLLTAATTRGSVRSRRTEGEEYGGNVKHCRSGNCDPLEMEGGWVGFRSARQVSHALLPEATRVHALGLATSPGRAPEVALAV